jgi:serine/threonine-protein kinase
MTDTLDRLRVALGAQYLVDKLVGEGGMASVYRAQDLRHGRAVAVKVLHDSLASGVHADRFLAEIRVTAGMQHPHILPLHDSGVHEGLLFYVMPFVEGARTLRSHIDLHTHLPVYEAVEIATAVGGALDYAHRRGIVHRDVKPENILLSDGVPIVADFGISRAISGGGSGASTRMTQAGMAIGTPHYMSPEQAAGDPNVDARTDVYALAAVLYEMLVGEPPFVGGGTQAVMRKLFVEPVPLARLVRPDVPPAIDALLQRGMAKDPAERPQAAAEFVAELRDASHRAFTTSERAAAVVVQDVPSLAVLPFANVSQIPDSEYFCDGMTDEIISTMARLPGIKVASRTSSFAFKGRQVTVREAGEALNVRYVLEGSVRQAGDRLRVTAQLVDVKSGHQKWADRFERRVDDVFALQDELATTIADALAVRLATSGGEEVTGVRRGTTNLDAYHLVLKGRHFWNARALDKAMECFQNAATIDSGYAQAWAGLADAFTFLGYYGVLPPDRAYDRGIAAAERAVNADPTLAEAQYARGIAAFVPGVEFEVSGRALRRASELGSRLGQVRATRSQWFDLHGRPTEAQTEAAVALDLEPLSSLIAGTIAWSAVMGGDAERAIQLGARGLDLDADAIACLWTKAGAHLELGDTASALPLLARAVERTRRAPFMVGLYGHALALSGERDGARALINELVDRPDGVRPGPAAWILAGLGDVDGAMPLYDEAARRHDAHLYLPIAMLRTGRAMRNDPRYRALIVAEGKSSLLDIRNELDRRLTS